MLKLASFPGEFHPPQERGKKRLKKERKKNGMKESVVPQAGSIKKIEQNVAI